MTAECDPGWNWTFNSFAQSPCVIAGALEAPCRDLVSYTLGPLNRTSYVAPQKGSALSCECNTVMYSLFSACTQCQGEQVQTWNFWAQFCDAVYVTQYPLEIPTDTAVPHWAYLNVTTTGTWSRNDSLAAVDQPESTGVESPTSTGSSNTGSKTVNLPTNSSNHSSGGGSNAGAIAGGIVGGLAGVGILAALAVWFIMKKKRSRVAPSSAFLNSYQSSNRFNHPDYEPPPPPPGPSSPSPTMVYSPSDHSMFSAAYPQTSYDAHAPRRGGYSGAPEV